MKLKTVTISYDYVIVVEDDSTENVCVLIALENAQEAFKDISTYDVDISIEDYRPGSLHGWDDRCIPYGGDGETTTGEYL